MKSLIPILIMLWSGSVQAATVHYDESSDGDLCSCAADESLVTVFQLGVGANTISGSTSGFTTPEETIIDTDAFILNLNPNLEIASITFDFSFVKVLYQDWDLHDGATRFDPLLVRDRVELGGSNPKQMFETALPVSNGDFIVRHAATGVSNYPWSVDYTWTVNVVNVIPIPPALLLFPSALAGLIWLRRNSQ